MFIQVETHENTLYERVGGQPFFTSLVERFYNGVETDPFLRPLYPLTWSHPSATWRCF
jgi:hemoglobin